MTTPLPRFSAEVPDVGMATRTDRIRRYVTAWCPRCHADAGGSVTSAARLPGYLSEAEGQVWLVRGCPTHGRVVTLYDEDPEILDWLERWTAPTKVHVPDTPGNFTPPPVGYLQGLGELQTQHTCILLVDVTDHCNLSCPTCFAASGPAIGTVVPVADVLAGIDQRLARENGRLDVVMLSGGEPTLHPEFGGLLEAILERDVVRVLVNTNGLTLTRGDHDVLDVLRRHRDRVEVYLQLDGLAEATHRHHRGADLRRVKAEAVAALSRAEVFTTLTMTIAKGVNDHEIGDVLDLALTTPFVTGVSLQPQFGAGRSGDIDPLDRLTHTGVLSRLGPQTGGRVTWRDLTALPCSHPHCCSVGYLFRTDSTDGDGRPEWRSLVSLLGAETLAAHLGLVANKGMADPALAEDLRVLVRESLLGLLSERSSLTHPETAELFRTVCESCDLGVPGLLRLARAGSSRRGLRRLLAERVVRVTVKPFMDIDTMVEERLLQCCVHVGTRSVDDADQCAPFCAVQSWAELADGRLSRSAAVSPVGAPRSTAATAGATGDTPDGVATADAGAAPGRRLPLLGRGKGARR